MREAPEERKPASWPGPGRSTAEAALNARKKEIAERNDRAFKEARQLRAVREREQAAKRRANSL
jgi:hypothetical protein